MRLRRFTTLASTLLIGASAGLLSAPSTGAVAAGPDLSPDISVTAVTSHLQKLQAIAFANGGNRATGRSGHRASLAYYKGLLDAAGYRTEVQTFWTLFTGSTSNLIATWPGTDPNSVVMLGGHLDSVTNGPGINDNGSGTAALLESALAFARSGQTPRNTLRFAFWTGEEQGLFGSAQYAKTLSDVELRKIRLYLNFDMIASPNVGYFVYDDNAAGNSLRDEMTQWYADHGVQSEFIDVQGRSDHASLRAKGVPTGGIFSGAEETKTAAQAQKWGGTAGVAFDKCYHLACDNLTNINTAALDLNADLIGHMVFATAQRDFGSLPVPVGTDLIVNGSFEDGRTVWTGDVSQITNSIWRPALLGSWKAWLGGNSNGTPETITQTVTIPSTIGGARLSWSTRIDSAEPSGSTDDKLTVQIVDGSSVATVGTLTSADRNSSWHTNVVDVSAYKGKTVTVRLSSTEDIGAQTSFVVDVVKMLTY